MSEKKKKKIDGLVAGMNLDQIRENLEDSAEILRGSIPSIEKVKNNRKEIAEKLKLIEENVGLVKKLLKKMRDKSKRIVAKGKSIAAPKKLPAPKKKEVVQFLPEAEYKKLYPKKKKAVVYFQKSDFSSLDEYLDYMRKPLISDEEAARADWDNFLKKLSKWKPSK